MSHKLQQWKNPIVLLSSLGIANVGDFIYLVAINIIVYQMTESATAVALLWIIGPLTNILTKFWTGSYIDYRSKRKIMIQTFIARGLLIMLIPLAPSVVVIYILLVFLSIARAFFGPSSMTYTTMLVPIEMRKRFNAIRSFTSSSAFIIGPSIGGLLILLMNVNAALWFNGILFIVAALLLLTLPDLDEREKSSIPKLTIHQIKEDFSLVLKFFSENKYISFIYITFILIMVATFAMDSQEVVFTQQVIGLSEFEYSLLVSITGIGSVTGGVILSVFSKHFSLRYMIAVGVVMSSVGYLVYAFSWSFLSITAGFIVLGFFLVFLNAGVTTFYQNNVPVELMGRTTSIIQLIQSIAQTSLILIVGLLGDIISLRVTIISLASLMFVFALVYSLFIFKPNYKGFYKEEKEGV
ncbi:MFS transporter [Alkalibacillus haloalkaliphilus]|uniref:MFS transporter n=1 Tax=Alkalibacillus haloalkaliphilus TaxID=94136 RepID=UPI002935674F|nr:MFS transporter [Alkalibacillus haloalkaliphilus]MDV2581753.1 MFS transporter [Alkalibacillus haloalkaliphilus]